MCDKMKWHLSQGLGDEQEDKGKCFKETLKCFEKNKKKGKEKKRSPKKLRANHFGNNKMVVLNQVRLKAQL